MFNLEEFLLMREKRVEIQNSIIEKEKKPILVLRGNYPGENKNDFIPTNIVKVIYKEILDIFNDSIVHTEIINSIEGITYIFSINDNGTNIKKIAMEIEENHILGRYVDIDVFSESGYAFSRSDFGGSKRKCFLCDEMAFVCGRKQSHSILEITSHIQKKYESYLIENEKRFKISDFLSDIALKSLILEVSASPSFGLVSPFTKGAHTDMDFFTFIDSSFSINHYFKEVAKVGFSSLSLDLIFKKIRFLGKLAEKEMFLATNNINTHKGMIFLMGISIATTAKAKFENKSFLEIKNNIKFMCRDILKDFVNLETKSNLTHGEKLFLNHGISGVRGIVKDGLDIIFNGSLDVFSNALIIEKDINCAMIKTLIFLMSSLEDTTILHRHNISILNEVKKKARDLHCIFSNCCIDKNILKDLENEYTNNKISPGGSADLLAITLFFNYSKKIF